MLSKYQKPGAPFPEGGLGSADTEGCRAVKAIKQMMSKAIELSIFDEAGAIAGLCPLEQIADASGIAVGGTVLQMTRDLSRMKISKGRPAKRSAQLGHCAGQITPISRVLSTSR